MQPFIIPPAQQVITCLDKKKHILVRGPESENGQLFYMTFMAWLSKWFRFAHHHSASVRLTIRRRRGRGFYHIEAVCVIRGDTGKKLSKTGTVGSAARGEHLGIRNYKRGSRSHDQVTVSMFQHTLYILIGIILSLSPTSRLMLAPVFQTIISFIHEFGTTFTGPRELSTER